MPVSTRSKSKGTPLTSNPASNSPESEAYGSLNRQPPATEEHNAPKIRRRPGRPRKNPPLQVQTQAIGREVGSLGASPAQAAPPETPVGSSPLSERELWHFILSELLIIFRATALPEDDDLQVEVTDGTGLASQCTHHRPSSHRNTDRPNLKHHRVIMTKM